PSTATSGSPGGSPGEGPTRPQDFKPAPMQLKKKKARKFSSVEDLELGRAVAHNTGALNGEAWKKIALSLPGRSANQCRRRWSNYVDPNLKTTPWSNQEFRLLHLAQRMEAASLPGKNRSMDLAGKQPSKGKQHQRPPVGIRVKMPRKYKQAPPSTSRGGTCAKDSGGAFSGGRQGVPSTRDLHVLVDWTSED
ncbi:unnamed protein product, partial [Ectocarpus fasciculatus]